MHTLALPRLRPSFARTLLTVLLVYLVAIALGACASLNPVAVAVTPDQKYDAILLTYNALLEPATQLVEDVTVPPNVRRAIQTAVGASAAVYSGANQAYLDFKAAKSAVAGGADTEGKLAIATANLEKWSGQLDGIVSQLKTLTHRN